MSRGEPFWERGLGVRSRKRDRSFEGLTLALQRVVDPDRRSQHAPPRFRQRQRPDCPTSLARGGVIACYLPSVDPIPGPRSAMRTRSGRPRAVPRLATPIADLPESLAPAARVPAGSPPRLTRAHPPADRSAWRLPPAARVPAGSPPRLARAHPPADRSAWRLPPAARVPDRSPRHLPSTTTAPDRSAAPYS